MWEYAAAAVLASSALCWWAWNVLLGHGDECGGCLRLKKSCSCADPSCDLAASLLCDRCPDRELCDELGGCVCCGRCGESLAGCRCG